MSRCVSEQGACSVVPREDIHAFKVASYDEVNGPGSKTYRSTLQYDTSAETKLIHVKV